MPLTVKEEAMQQKKVRQPSCLDQNEVASSKAKIVPPIGAPNAADIP
jgi:hypothetical protein